MKQMGSPHSEPYRERIECLHDHSQKKYINNDNFQKIMLSHRLRRIKNEHFECSIGNYFHGGGCGQVALGPDLYVLHFILLCLEEDGRKDDSCVH